MSEKTVDVMWQAVVIATVIIFTFTILGFFCYLGWRGANDRVEAEYQHIFKCINALSDRLHRVENYGRYPR